MGEDRFTFKIAKFYSKLVKNIGLSGDASKYENSTLKAIANLKQRSDRILVAIAII